MRSAPSLAGWAEDICDYVPWCAMVCHGMAMARMNIWHMAVHSQPSQRFLHGSHCLPPPPLPGPLMRTPTALHPYTTGLHAQHVCVRACCCALPGVLHGVQMDGRAREGEGEDGDEESSSDVSWRRCCVRRAMRARSSSASARWYHRWGATCWRTRRSTSPSSTDAAREWAQQRGGGLHARLSRTCAPRAKRRCHSCAHSAAAHPRRRKCSYMYVYV